MGKPGISVLLIVVGLALVSGCATMKGETAVEYVDDVKITDKVAAIIANDPDAHFVEIETTTTRGDVVLEGFVKNRESETRIVSQVKDLTGVNSVKSLLRLEENWRVARENKR